MCAFLCSIAVITSIIDFVCLNCYHFMVSASLTVGCSIHVLITAQTIQSGFYLLMMECQSANCDVVRVTKRSGAAK